MAGSRQELAPLGHRLASGSLPRVSDHRAREQKQNSYLLQSATPLALNLVLSFLKPCQEQLCTPRLGIPA